MTGNKNVQGKSIFSPVFRCLAAAWCAMLLGASPAAIAAESDKPLLVGFVPAFNTERMVGMFEPFVDYLASGMGVALRMETAPDLKEFLRRTNEEKRYDFLFTAPHFYLVAERKADYRAIARVKGTDIRAVLVVRQDSPINIGVDLRGKEIASLEPSALVTILGKAKLRSLGLVPGTDVAFVETPNMDASLQAVLRKRTDAALLLETFFKERLPPEIRGQLRGVIETEAAPAMPISISSHTDPALADKLVAVLLAMPDTPEGAQLLRKLAWPGFVRATPKDYAVAAPLLHVDEN